MIRNKINNKKYIGQAKDVDRRWRLHINELRKNTHYNKYLQRAWNKYGEDNFEFIILCECKEEELSKKEIYYIAQFDTFKNGYNLTIGGEGTRGYKFTDEQLRYRQTEEFRKTMTEIIRKRSSNPEYREKMSKTLKEKYSNPEYREKMCKILEEIRNRPEYRAKRSELSRGKNNPMYGKKHSEETRKKISEAHKGRKLSEEQKAKLSEIEKGEGNPMYGKRHSEETKAKMREKRKGTTHSKETKIKLSIKNGRAIYCVTNTTIYPSCKEVERHLNVPRSSLLHVCRNNHTYKKLNLEFWFLDEWNKISGYIKEGEIV